MPTPQEILETQVEISELFHIYGELLSNRQRAFIQLYYDENLSLSEIANQHNISRQAVHDAIKHGRRALTKYESTLGLLEIKSRPQSGAAIREVCNQMNLILDEMEKSVRENGLDYSGRLLAQIASMRELIARPISPGVKADETGEAD